MTLMEKDLPLSPLLSLRERGKQKRRQAIKEAARQAFFELGYEQATTREIANRAEVSPGTLFAYAPTKPELLLMIINDDLEAMSAQEFEGAEEKPLMQLLLDFALPRYRYWRQLGPLARPARQEILGLKMRAQPAGPEGWRSMERAPRILAELAAIVAGKQALGSIRSEASPASIAAVFWAIYYGEIERWLSSESPDVEDGLARLRELLVIAIQGVGADAAEYALPRRRKAAARA